MAVSLLLCLSQALLSAGCTAVTHGAERSRLTEIGGFRVDLAQTPKSLLQTTRANLQLQVDIIHSAGLPDAVISFFRTVPIVIDPLLAGMNGRLMRRDGRWVVRARPGHWPADRAILLHELLHVYHLEVLGRSTPAINRAFEEAKRDGTYSPDYRGAHFLSAATEYFAVVGEVFLAGPTFRPPFNCRSVRNAQPEVITYLSGLFGERECL